jgi:D-lactate dehydrogenase (cytochrome)
MDGAANTVIETIQLGIPVARIEIVDEAQLRVVNAYSKTDYPIAPTLFFEFHGITDPTVEDQIRAVEAIAREHGARGFDWAASPEARSTLWRARHNAYYATVATRPGARAWTTDVCVPISQLAACIRETQDDISATGLEAPLVGHAGDGNFHLIIMLDPGGSSNERCGSGARAAASTASASASSATSRASMARGWTSCARSNRRSIRSI